MVLSKAIFLDKDGVLVRNVPYNVVPALVELNFNVPEALHKLSQLGYKLFVVTNQSGVARGYFPEIALEVVHAYLEEILKALGCQIEGFYYCPHHPDGIIPELAINCNCRKPKPGLIQRAAQEHSIDLSKSWVIGDILNDVEAGKSAGCRTILLNNGGETEWQLSPQRLPDHVVSDLLDAARIITAYSDAN